jgi:hypothetical protein
VRLADEYLAWTAASAAIVCNAEGDRWHIRGSPEYKPELRLQIHPDDWKCRDPNIIDGASMKAMAIGAAAPGSKSNNDPQSRPRLALFLESFTLHL